MTNGALNVHSNQRKTDKYIKTELFEFDMFSRLVQAKKSYDKRRDLGAFPSWQNLFCELFYDSVHLFFG